MLTLAYTAAQLHLDDEAVPVGQYARFDCLGRRLLEITDRLSNGLGLIFQRGEDGLFRRVIF